MKVMDKQSMPSKSLSIIEQEDEDFNASSYLGLVFLSVKINNSVSRCQRILDPHRVTSSAKEIRMGSYDKFNSSPAKL